MYKTQETKCMYTCPSTLISQRNDMPMSTPWEFSPHRAEIICLVSVSPQNLLASGGQRNWGLAHICTFSSIMWPHIYYTSTDRTESSHVKKSSELPGRAFTTSRLPDWRDHCDKKKSPLSLSILNSCHINNFLHWDVQTPHKQFPTVQREAPRGETQCAFILIYLP